MKFRALVATFGCVALGMVFLVVPNAAVKGESNSTASAPSPNDEIVSELNEKIVLFEVNRGSTLESKSGSVVLHKVHVTKLGTRSFIIGVGYAPADAERDEFWNKGMTVGFPCESIIRFQAMTSDQFNEYTKRWKDRSDK